MARGLGQGQRRRPRRSAGDDFARVTHGSDEPLSAAAYKEQILQTRRAFPDLTTSIDDIVEDGDQLAIFWTSTGTHRDELLGIPTTNRRSRPSARTCARSSTAG